MVRINKCYGKKTLQAASDNEKHKSKYKTQHMASFRRKITVHQTLSQGTIFKNMDKLGWLADYAPLIARVALNFNSDFHIN